MAYPATPKTWVSGDVLTAAQLNAELRDALLGAFPNGVGAWEPWTPTLTNLTLGNGTLVAKYARIGRTVHLIFTFTLGSTSAVGSSPRFTLPVAASAAFGLPDVCLGSGTLLDVATAAYGALLIVTNSTTVGPRRLDTGDLYAQQQNVNAVSPFIWTTGDMMTLTGTYESAS